MSKQPIPRRIRILQLQTECHDRSHDPTDLAEQIVAAFPRDRFEVTSAFLQGHPEPGQAKSCAEHVHYFEFPEKAMRGLRLSLHHALWRYCREGQFDVVICNRFKPVSMLMTINRFLSIPVCVGISHSLGEYDRFWRRRLAAFSIRPNWRFVGVSSTVRDYLIDLGCGFTPDNTLTIPNALDLKVVEDMFLPRAAAREELGLPLEARLIGAIGRLVPLKGHIYLIQAFAAIAAHHPDVHLAIIGDGREETKLREAVEQHGLADRVHLLGWRTRAKRYIRAFDLWTMPSLKEGLPLALLEGMCGQLPIIATNIPSMRALIDCAGGLAVPPADADALAEALDQYLRLDDEALHRKGLQAYAHVRDNMTIEQYRGAWLQLVEQALASRSG
ncbi:glycosyltransferase [Azonexus sp.]|jgi:glycosyltransferase involved in cell wall biosynthesis|uniref:glycosyltransferase n=1 Tax=Azonexus sp. TaxID=1872668 RepID=UPI0028286815|nr:glycosyltransferase [Azonexus sp.]MDR1996644.1 glycosyltransferase [Azonexus sp.]